MPRTEINGMNNLEYVTSEEFRVEFKDDHGKWDGLGTPTYRTLSHAERAVAKDQAYFQENGIEDRGPERYRIVTRSVIKVQTPWRAATEED